jgi:uncharacterized protein YcbK (DUF882 family)
MLGCTSRRLVYAGEADRPVDANASQGSAARWLELLNTHTNETVRVIFHDGSAFVPAALAKLQHVLRDHRVNEEHAIDPALYMQLSDLAQAAGVEPRYEVISGFRSPATNAALRSQGRNVADKSLHIQGRAIDVRLVGYSTAALRDLALKMRRGGVGYYERSNFVHLDTGRVRTWIG